MIAYRVTRDDGQAIVRLPVRKLGGEARLVIDGDAALAQEVRRRIMHDFHLAPKEFSSVTGYWLRDWMESREMKDLTPLVVEGLPIVRYGGTMSQDDCREGLRWIATWLASLATLARDPIWEHGGTYEWQNIVEGKVMMLLYELAAWRESCSAAPEHRSALEPAIAAQLAERGAAGRYEPAQLVAAFDCAKELGSAERILPEYWRILDTEGSH